MNFLMRVGSGTGRQSPDRASIHSQLHHAILALAVLALALGGQFWASAGAWAGDAFRDPVHPDLGRARFESTKLSNPDKGGADGDAAVTSDRYDVLRYFLDLRIDPEADSLAGRVQMVFSSRVDQLGSMVFDLADELPVEVIEHSSGLLSFTQAGDSVVVQLNSVLSADAVDSFTVVYGGFPVQPDPQRGLMYLSYEMDGHAGPSVASMSEPAYAKHWWPCKDRPDDKALSRVNLTVPEGLVGVSNGTLVGTWEPEAGWITYDWREDYPIATYLISVAISDYALLEDPCSTTAGSTIPLMNWVFPPEVEEALVDFAPLCEMMDVCEEMYGPYPFQGEKYGHAEFLWNGGMEHQTVTSIGATSLRGDGSRDWLIVHELGHQWFGDSLTPASWADIWLNEGFATYTEALWREHLGGRSAYLDYMQNLRTPWAWPPQGPVYDPVPVFPGRVIYDKAAWILHMLRGRLGDQVFFDMVRAWAQDPANRLGNVSTEDFIAHVEGYAGESLADFFWPYLESTELPLIEFNDTLMEGPNGSETQVSIELRQHQAPLFDNIFPLVVTTTAGSQTHLIQLSGQTAELVVQTSEPIVQVELDPEGWVLWEMLGSGAVRSGLLAAYPNPAQDGYIQFLYRLGDLATVKWSIHDARGRLVYQTDQGWTVVESGGNLAAWNLRDQDGRRVPSGVYWARFEINGQFSVKKFTVAH